MPCLARTEEVCDLSLPAQGISCAIKDMFCNNYKTAYAAIPGKSAFACKVTIHKLPCYDTGKRSRYGLCELINPKPAYAASPCIRVISPWYG